MTPEGKVKRKVNTALAPLIERKLVWKFMPVQMGRGIPALDYLLCVNGFFVVIETKEKGKTLTGRQETTKTAMEVAGAKVYVVDDDLSLGIAMVEILKLCP